MLRLFAVFAVAPLPGGVAATTRAADRGEAGLYGLPGGKVDDGEDPRAALIREAREEGWLLTDVSDRPFFVAPVDGRMVAWYAARAIRPLTEYKERHRGIRPVVVAPEILIRQRPSYGNDRALAIFFKVRHA